MLTFRSVLSATLTILIVGLSMWRPALFRRTDEVALAQSEVRIESPADGAVVSGRIDVRVTVAMANPDEIDFYRLYVGNGRTPAALRPLGPPHMAAVTNESIASLDTTLLQTGEAMIQLRLYPKGADEIDAAVVVSVQAGPTPTRTLSGPVVVVPPLAVAPPPAQPSAAAQIADYPTSGLLDVSLPDFSLGERTSAPIPRLTPENIYDTLPGDPVQTDPILQDIFAPPPPIVIPSQPNIVPIPR